METATILIPENKTKYSTPLLSNVWGGMYESFGYDFSMRQLAEVINRQSKDVVESLVNTDGNPASVDALINEISKKVTGMDYPLPGAPIYQLRKFEAKFNIKKASYFGKVIKMLD